MEEIYEEVPVKSGGDFKSVSAGIHPAICVAVIRLGTQETNYLGEKKIADKILLRFEVHSEGEVTDKREPLIIGKRYTFSFHEKSALFNHAKAWQGVNAVSAPNFNVFRLLGQPCNLIITEDVKGDKTYANITNIMPYKGALLTPFNKLVAFSLKPESFKQDTFDALPQWIRDIVIASPEFKALKVAIPHKDVPHDDGLPAYLND
jgi:hypothetical protein